MHQHDSDDHLSHVIEDKAAVAVQKGMLWGVAFSILLGTWAYRGLQLANGFPT